MKYYDHQVESAVLFERDCHGKRVLFPIMERRHILLSGGVGSGKSTVGALLEKAGFEVLSADAIGHDVLENEARTAVISEWPEVLVDGCIDREALAGIVFSRSEALSRLERITHPHIRRRVTDRLDGAAVSLVVELHALSDFLPGRWVRLVVDVPDDLRVVRLVRRGWSQEEALRRMRSQPTRLEYLCNADFIIDNSRGFEYLAPQVDGFIASLGDDSGFESR